MLDKTLAAKVPFQRLNFDLDVMQDPRDGHTQGIDRAADLAQELAEVSAQVAQTTEANANLVQQLQHQLLQCQSLAVQMQQAQWAGICL